MADLKFGNAANGESSEDSVRELIRAAGGYVRPNDQLRPRILDEVRELSEQRRQRGSLLRVAVMSMATVSCVMMLSLMLRTVVPRGRTSEEVQQQAQRQALSETKMVTSGVQVDWALSEIVDQWRRPTTNVSGSRWHR